MFDCPAERLGSEVRNLTATDSMERSEILAQGKVLAEETTSLDAMNELEFRGVQFDADLGVLDNEGQGMTYICRFPCDVCADYVVMEVTDDKPDIQLPDACRDSAGQQG